MAPKVDEIPLAERIRPQDFERLLGQEKILGAQSLLRRLIEKDRFNSILLWGPSGSGKTTLVTIIGKKLQRRLICLSAVKAGVKDIKAVLEQSKALVQQGQKSLILFMDEIHRLNRSQQDVLLPALEDGSVKFIAATTLNPSFEVNNAILSRSLVFQFAKIDQENLIKIMQNAMAALPEEFPAPTRIDTQALDAIARSADGDARRALNVFEAVFSIVPSDERITIETVRAYCDAIITNYDKNQDMHYDVISAFIKSIRASHPDAAIYYLARMVEAGEDPMFIARRLVILASEDIGNANPLALLVANSAMQAVYMIGYPEARIILAQATTYLASSFKSNRSYLALEKARKDVKTSGSLSIPYHLRNAPTKLMKEFNYGLNYVYAHDDPRGARSMSYLPNEMKGTCYYDPSDIGAEEQIRERLTRIKPTAD